MSDILKLLKKNVDIVCGSGVICTIKDVCPQTTSDGYEMIYLTYLKNKLKHKLSVILKEGDVRVVYKTANNYQIFNDLDLLNAMRINADFKRSIGNADPLFTDIIGDSDLKSSWGLSSLLIWNDALKMNTEPDTDLHPQYVYATENTSPEHVPELQDYTFALIRKWTHSTDMVIRCAAIGQNNCYVEYNFWHVKYVMRLVRRGDSIFSARWHTAVKIITSVDEFFDILASNSKTSH